MGRFTRDEVKTLEKVAVVVVMEESLRGIDQGTTIVQHKEFTANLQPWEVNRISEDITKEILRQCLGVIARDIPYDMPSLLKRYRAKSMTPFGDYSEDFGEIRNELINLGRLNGLDAIVVVLEQSFRTFARGQLLRGYTLLQSTVVGTGSIDLYVIHEIRVLDLRHGIEAARSPYLGNITDDKLSLTLWVNPENLVWREYFDAYSDQEKANLISAIRRKSHNQIASALNDMGFTSSELPGCPKPQ
jgi:hypothetical protein